MKIFFFFLLFIPANCFSQDSLSFTEIGFGTTIEPNMIYSVELSLEKKLMQFKKFSFKFDYNFSKLQGGYSLINNRNNPTNRGFLVRRRLIVGSINWHPIRTEKQPFSLLSIGLGAGYYRQWFNDTLVDYGPSLNATVGGSYCFKQRLTVSLKTRYLFFYNYDQINLNRYKFNLYLITLGVGYRMGLNK